MGLPYSADNRKVIVLMSDGKNELAENGRYASGSLSSTVKSEYTAYGNLNEGQFPIENFQEANKFLNERLALACSNAKARGIVIYTILFRETDPDTVDLMRNCATSAGHAYLAGNEIDLSKAFGSVGASINKLRISK